MKSITVRGSSGGAITLLEDGGDSYGGRRTHLTVIAVADSENPTAAWLSLDYHAAQQLIFALAEFTADHPFAPPEKGPDAT